MQVLHDVQGHPVPDAAARRHRGRCGRDSVGHARRPDHAIHSAKIFNQLKPMLVGTGGLTLFPGTPLLEEAQRGEFTPLTEKELMEELMLFVENLECDCEFNTHHTSSLSLSGPFLPRK